MLCHTKTKRKQDEQRGYCLGFMLCRLPLWLLWLGLCRLRRAVAIAAAIARGISLLLPPLVFLIRFMSREIKIATLYLLTKFWFLQINLIGYLFAAAGIGCLPLPPHLGLGRLHGH
jgi:hypothetical protein